MAIRRGCKKLRKVTLSDLYYVGDHSLVAIAGGSFQLEVLEINYYHTIGSVRLQAVHHSCL
uniref:Uncharacterized protein n=1 Tax=Physcomitrium patens TaxID=3218 RepID=A0A2K1K3D7_PHYPA|nr:hypothetical protein PHYPA_012770 [Physcomitrium patens]